MDEIEAPRDVGDKQYRIFKFYINNGHGKRVQVIVWNDDIDYILPHIKLNYVSYF